MGPIAGRFARVEPRHRLRALVLGPLSDLPRKNRWPVAEWAGEASPGGMQHLLGRARWDADRVRDDVREYVLERSSRNDHKAHETCNFGIAHRTPDDQLSNPLLKIVRF
jgi:SRSO17 transposase